VVRAAASIGRRDRMLVRRQSGRRLIRSPAAAGSTVVVVSVISPE
jgi:hypothetical protein